MRCFAMPDGKIILASASPTRQDMLRKIHLSFEAKPAFIDEEAIKMAGQEENVPQDDIVVTLAELKAQQIADSAPDYILGCDQILTCEDKIFSKPQHPDDARAQLAQLSGKTHYLKTAIVVFHNHRRIWHHLATSTLHMRKLDKRDIEDYSLLYEPQLTQSPGSYQIENGGAHLFHKIEGDFYDILGLPLLPLLDFLRNRGLSLSSKA